MGRETAANRRFREKLRKMSPCERLEYATLLYAPMGFDKRGRRRRVGLISKKAWLRIIN